MSAQLDAKEGNGWLTVPNALTLARLAAIIPFAVLASHGRDSAALVLFVLAGITDTLDGTIARRFGQSSKAGRLLDPLADKLFTGVSFVVPSIFRGGLTSIPSWVMFVVLTRDILILSGSFIVYRATGSSGFQPSIYGKLNTFIEIAVVVLFLGQAAFSWITGILPILYLVLLISLVVSTGNYLLAGLRMMRDSSGE